MPGMAGAHPTATVLEATTAVLAGAAEESTSYAAAYTVMWGVAADET